MKLLITTQVYENYAWKEDGSIGKGDDAYWKAKGGDEYVVTGIWDEEEAVTAVMVLRKDIEKDTDYYREQVIDWQLLDNEELTPFEQDQMEYEGRIVYPAKELTWA
jgi:predicted ATP-binding protein involved in virulence